MQSEVEKWSDNSQALEINSEKDKGGLIKVYNKFVFYVKSRIWNINVNWNEILVGNNILSCHLQNGVEVCQNDW